MRTPRKWIYFFALMPGAGHFYLEYMTRGLQLMLLFFGTIFISSQLYGGFLLIFIPVIYFYSYFDAIKQYHWIKDTGFREDRPIIPWEIITIHRRWVGWALIVFAFLIGFNTFFTDFIYTIFPYEISDFLFNYGSKVLAIIIIIIVGIALIRSERDEKENWPE
ncbi:hypothetical protein [Listeria costaricensis]|uniref:hypothetical protein n=1 Tax=Listeria costaricensis TaxID=2026604 RepID=UPI000C07977E|nr:hypothetical protein [Listeria costaricensis]